MVGSGDAVTVCGLKLLSSSQTVGLLAVLAVSGSVALITIGKQKLWHHHLHQVEEEEDDDDDDEDDAEVNDVSDVKPLDTSGNSCIDTVVTTIAPRDCCSSSFKNATGKQPHPVVKKVRFAPDVVDPTGDGREYRWRKKTVHSSSNSSSSTCTQIEHGKTTNAGSNQVSVQIHQRPQILVKPSLPANRMVLYNGIQRYKSFRALQCMS